MRRQPCSWGQENGCGTRRLVAPATHPTRPWLQIWNPMDVFDFGLCPGPTLDLHACPPGLTRVALRKNSLQCWTAEWRCCPGHVQSRSLPPLTLPRRLVPPGIPGSNALSPSPPSSQPENHFGNKLKNIRRPHQEGHPTTTPEAPDSPGLTVSLGAHLALSLCFLFFLPHLPSLILAFLLSSSTPSLCLPVFFLFLSLFSLSLPSFSF